MSSVQIILGETWKSNVAYLHGLTPQRPANTSLDFNAVKDVIDIVLHGTNITSYVDEEYVFELILDLTEALNSLLEGQSLKSLIEFPSQPWELVLFPCDGSLLISVYSIDRNRQIMAYNRPVDPVDFGTALLDTGESILQELYAISDELSTHTFVRDFSRQLASLKQNLSGDADCFRRDPLETQGLHHANTSYANGLTFQYTLDADYLGLRRYSGEHMLDLHALLVPGEIAVEYRGERVVLNSDYPFLFAESLAGRIREVLNSLESSSDSPDVFGGELPHADVRVRRNQGDGWQLILACPAEDRDQQIELDAPPDEVIDWLLSFLEMFLSDLLELNPKLELDHRFLDLSKEIKSLRQWHNDLSATNVYHHEPETYIEQLGHLELAPLPRPPRPTLATDLAELEQLFCRIAWHLEASNIYFDSIYPLPEGLVIPTSEQIEFREWADGSVRWSRECDETETASLVATGSQLVTVHPNQGLELLDLETGQSECVDKPNDAHTWQRLRSAVEFSGQNLLVVGDHQGRLLGVDMESMTVDWVFSSGHGQFTGTAFQGPIAAVLTGESFLYAVNPIDGETLWKVGLEGATRTAPHFHQGRLYAFSHDSVSNKLTTHAFYPFTGREAWQVRLSAQLAGSPSFHDNWLLLPVERHGQMRLAAIDLEAPQPDVEWRLDLSSAGLDRPSDVLFVDIDKQLHGLIRTDRAELTCFRLADGAVHWRHMPEDSVTLLQGNLPLIRIRDTVLSVEETIQFHSIETGRRLHRLDYLLKNPKFLSASGQLWIAAGEHNPRSGHPDELVVLDLNHYLAEVQ